MANTRIGIPTLAPDLAPGTVVKITLRVGDTDAPESRSTVDAEIVETADGHRCFVDIYGRPIALPIIQWRAATSLEAMAFRIELRVSHWADHAVAHGAGALRDMLRTHGLSRLERDAALCAVSDELRCRGKDTLASAVLEFRFEEP